jgi:hypothetical protein
MIAYLIILSLPLSALIGFSIGYSFSYWKDKIYGGTHMANKTDVIDTGESKEGIIKTFFGKKKAKVQEAVKVQPKPEQKMPAELPALPEAAEVPVIDPPSTDEEIDVAATLQSIITDLGKMSEHMVVLKDAVRYIQGYLKGKNAI